MPRNLGFSDGSSMSIDRTREAGERTLGFSDGSSIKVDRSPSIQEDEAGNSRPLLGKLIGGAAVAYSLRDLNDKQGENNVVNVRRSEDNEEKIFKAKDVSIINKWVNGEQDTTLPCDVSSPASAYSLRKVKKSYNGPLVRLRRTMDNCEVDVYPDSDGKVSEKSRIVNKDGRLSTTESQDKTNTSAQTLGKFIKPVGENLVIDNVANIINTSTNALSHYNTLFDQRAGGRDCFYLSAQGSTRSSNSGESYHKYNQHYTALRSMSPNTKKVAGEKVVVKYEYYVPSITPTTLNGQVGVTNTCRGILAQTPYSPETVTPARTDAHNIQLDTWLEGQTIIDNGNGTQATVYNAIRLRLAFKYTGDGNVYYDTNRQNDDEINVDGHGCYLRNIRVYSDTTDAKVVSWYDQGTANDDATAITHDAQPNLVENGVLLSDGISFDGVNNFLNTQGVLTDNRSASIFTKVKALTADATATDWFYTEGYSGTNGSISESIGIGITDTGNIADITASTDVNTNDGQASLLANGGLISLIGGTVLTTSRINGTLMGAITTPTNASGTYTIADGDNKGGIGGHSSTSSLAKFSIEELLLYPSDQSLNRFKIESNINNYYGLYNDANEVTGAFTSEGAASFTPNGTDGFTLETDEDSSYGGIQLKEKVASGKSIYVSFNLDLTLEGTASPTLALRQSTVDGALAVSGVTTLSQGFNGITLTSNNSNAEFITFGEGNDDVTYKVSDFKVSRIARDGFVETWYDQSGNGNDATQVAYPNQPQIVENGGLLKVGNKASIKFDGSDDFLDRDTFTQGDLAQPSTAFAVAKLRVYVDDNQKIFDGHLNVKRNMLQLNQAGNGQFASYAGTVHASGENADNDQHLFVALYNEGSSKLIIDGVVKNSSSVGSQAMQGINIGANYNSIQNFWDGDIQEIIIYNSDHIKNRLALEANINKQYQIYN